MDKVSKENRSDIMRKVKSKETKPERSLRNAVYRAGLLGYRKNYSLIPGTPDLVYTKYKIAIFVDGCFWHGCEICNKTIPITNNNYWHTKIIGNRDRDIRIDKQLLDLGWIVLRFWEHQIDRELPHCVTTITDTINQRRRTNG